MGGKALFRDRRSAEIGDLARSGNVQVQNGELVADTGLDLGIGHVGFVYPPEGGTIAQSSEDGEALAVTGGRGKVVREVQEALDIPVELVEPVIVTPSFVLVEGGREIGRITGYRNDDMFWGLLGQLLAGMNNPVESRKP